MENETCQKNDVQNFTVKKSDPKVISILGSIKHFKNYRFQKVLDITSFMTSILV